MSSRSLDVNACRPSTTATSPDWRYVSLTTGGDGVGHRFVSTAALCQECKVFEATVSDTVSCQRLGCVKSVKSSAAAVGRLRCGLRSFHAATAAHLRRRDLPLRLTRERRSRPVPDGTGSPS